MYEGVKNFTKPWRKAGSERLLRYRRHTFWTKEVARNQGDMDTRGSRVKSGRKICEIGEVTEGRNNGKLD